MKQDVLLLHLEQYRHLALDLGMTDAKIIPASSVIIDPRVRMKCKYPRCGYYGTCGNCPPYSISIEEMQRCVDRYQYAIFFMKRVASDELLGEQKADRGCAKPGNTQKLMYETAAKIEAAAFRDGHCLATGFANGPCKKLYCSNIECSALQPGGRCRAPLKSRGSMEGAGMHAFLMAHQVGWDVLPAGHSATAEQVPYLMNLGLVLVE